MGSYVFAGGSCVVFWRNSTVMLHENDVWDAEDPFVVERPEFFKEEPPVLRSTLSAEERAARPKSKLTGKELNQALSAKLASLSADEKKALAARLLASSEQA